jgi:hypothetical protein
MAIDGLVVFFFLSKEEIKPWFQIDFGATIIVKAIKITAGIECCGEKLRDVSIHVGFKPAVIGAVVTNTECAYYKGPSAAGKVQKITCQTPLRGQYLQVQMRDSSPSTLQINEIEVIKETGNYSSFISDPMGNLITT